MTLDIDLPDLAPVLMNLVDSLKHVLSTHTTKALSSLTSSDPVQKKFHNIKISMLLNISETTQVLDVMYAYTELYVLRRVD